MGITFAWNKEEDAPLAEGFTNRSEDAIGQELAVTLWKCGGIHLCAFPRERYEAAFDQ